ncbi:UDP-glucuronosyl/UDP-glucosyltransferase [Corchorus olitorius]|uniref:UDP-glucuronosyl/UDP-glucosyltransferase n=1 Tax=Corchorus olitorius TaxID=93759 RepID=A0A1R3J714_9ROSI|nr:UDP-glucuronosyl/UDP-glucosyltransferase [Corchorus olitorius]
MEKQRWGIRKLVLVPCPFQGHINPMLQLGTLLHATGFSITVAHTKFNFPNPENHPDFTFLPIPDALFDRGITSSIDLTDIISCLNVSCKAPLKNSLARIMESEKEDHGDQKLPCVIYDGSMYFAEAVAHELELPSIMLRTTNASTLLTYYSFPQLQKEGYLPLQDGMSLALVPGLYPLRFKDLPLANFKNLDILLQLMARTSDIRSSSAVICNTLDCLEQSSLAQLQEQCKVPVFPIGPLHTIVPSSSSRVKA